MKKFRFAAIALTALYAAAAYAAPQVPPKNDEGTKVPAQIASLLHLPDGCLVALPDLNGHQARVARVAARMSVWVADQKPGGDSDSLRPIIYLHREGDSRVTLHGPALDLNKTSNGTTTALDPKVAFIRNVEGKEDPMGFDHTDLVHWMPLDTFDAEISRIQDFKNGGPYTAGMFGIESFRVDNDRLYPRTLRHRARRHTDSYTVKVLMIKTLGRMRTFGICM